MGKRKPAAWGIVVRLDTGATLYYYLHPSRPGDEWTPRENQALRFSSEEEAQSRCRTFVTNSKAKEYYVVPLPLLKV
ncbi:hypothetical protein QEH68_11195 [Paenarthrobacter sp. OM7]|uniref:hypothetical protein n=1 Tax=Paenarthrobacter sp. OM7 TaxID=3041264 RepID=UPI002469041F|nr:hypothetical protein [Paenarthrobacter sp. OM7]WGM18631.1 hypothetical protein QEH68_11195 [Paenarthrobacter sp. OM7]